MDHDPIYNIKNEETLEIMCLSMPRIPKSHMLGTYRQIWKKTIKRTFAKQQSVEICTVGFGNM